MDIKEIDLCRLVEQTLADMEELIQDSGIPFKVDLPDEPVLMTNDGAKLSRVFQNLFSNALKYLSLIHIFKKPQEPETKEFIDIIKSQTLIL